jgi:hypothetical protein
VSSKFGGSNKKDNLVLSCSRCNVAKDLFSEFIRNLTWD